MKTLFTTLFIGLSISVMAQSDMMYPDAATRGACKDIKKEYKEFQQETNYNAPLIMNGGGYMYVAKTTKVDSASTMVILLSTSVSRPMYNAKGVFVKFDDGTIYRDTESPIECRYSSGSYRLTGAITINEENKDYFYNKKVVKYGLQDSENEVKLKTADKLQQSFKCVYEVQ